MSPTSKNSNDRVMSMNASNPPEMMAETVEEDSAESDVRESLRSLPRWLQPFITWGTGKSLLDAQPPRWMQSDKWKAIAPYYFFLSKALGFWFAVAGNTVVIFAIAYGSSGLWIFLMPVFWLLFVNSARGLQVETLHQSVHLQNTGNVTADWLIAEVASATVFCNSPARYGRGHVPVHHGIDIAGMKDPDVQFMFSILGMEPGMSVQEQQRRLREALVSPKTHARFLKARFAGVFSSDEKRIHDDEIVKYWPNGLDLTVAIHASKMRKVLTISIYLGLPLAATAYAVMYGVLWPILSVTLGLFLPGIWLYQCSAIMHFVGEHFWEFRNIAVEGVPFKEVMVRKTSARFYGEPAPDTKNDTKLEAYWKWLGWWLRFLFIHQTLRLLVSCSSLPWHDRHHTGPRDKNWIYGPYWRSLHIASGVDTYTENWTLGKQLNAVFRSISHLPPFSEKERAAAKVACQGEQVTDTFLGM